MWSHLALAAADAGLDDLSDYHLVQELDRAAQVAASWYAHRLKVIARLYHRPVMQPPPPDAEASQKRCKSLSREIVTAAEIAPKLQISEEAAGRLLRRALTITSRLPNTLALLSTGLIDEPRANAVSDLVGKLADWAYASVLEHDGSPRLAEHAATALAAMVERRVLPRAPLQRTDLLRDSLRRAIARIAPAYAAELIQAAAARRDVFVSHLGQEDQMGFLGAHLPIVEAKACYASLNSRAHALRDRGDLRTLDQLRADSLVDAILNPTPTPNLNGHSTTPRTTAAEIGAKAWSARHVARGVSAHIQVTVSLETLLNLNNAPAHLTDYGTITAETARSLAFQPDSTWRRLITDPMSGTLLDYGRTKYRPPKPLADHVIARDVTCTHPGCSRPAETCDLDHLLPFPLGVTCECNLHPRCRRHHRIKHETAWHTEVSTASDHPDGTLISTSPTGHSYPTYRPGLHPEPSS